MNFQSDDVAGAKPGPVITFGDFHDALRALELRPPEWYSQTYAPTYQMCLDSWPSRRMLMATSDYLVMLQRTGGDYSIPLVALAAFMLHIGYIVGRKHAEVDVLGKWMKM